MKDSVRRELPFNAAESQTPSMRGNSMCENRETRKAPLADGGRGRSGKAEPKPDRDADRESDGNIVPAKGTNKGTDDVPVSAEFLEERLPTKENAGRTSPAPDAVPGKRRGRGLFGVREAARRDKGTRFTALLHHLTPELLRASFFDLKKNAAPGVDGVTWEEYRNGLETRLANLHDRLHRGAYRAQPSRRQYIDKPGGGRRPLGIAALEDKIVQQAVRVILEQIYEEDYLGFSYGFRPGRGCHNALDALHVGLHKRKVNWVLDADIRGFFDAIDHQWMLRFLEHRIADPRILRLIRKWLIAGVSEDGQWSRTTVGTPQGAVISPLLANIYLHYVLDLWANQWRDRKARGEMILVRYADDFVLGFQHRSDAERFLRELHSRMEKFGLQLHPTKTRLIEFGRFAEDNRRQRGEGSPETFDFLGFTHYCGRLRNGRFRVKRRSIGKRLRATLQAIKAGLRQRMHWSLRDQGQWLRSVVQGWMNYHAVPFNLPALDTFRTQVVRLWRHSLQRRSQKARRKWTWKRMRGLVQRWIPPKRILHPHPDQRLIVTIQGRSRMR
ncbi:group II intron reverse transcriptase/maturase [candidate division GN15 bacterium]|nr:group II intron reverse transcriptase/maturase [candidate division GN15 bacterium]